MSITSVTQSPWWPTTNGTTAASPHGYAGDVHIFQRALASPRRRPAIPPPPAPSVPATRPSSSARSCRHSWSSSKGAGRGARHHRGAARDQRDERRYRSGGDRHGVWRAPPPSSPASRRRGRADADRHGPSGATGTAATHEPNGQGGATGSVQELRQLPGRGRRPGAAVLWDGRVGFQPRQRDVLRPCLGRLIRRAVAARLQRVG